MDIVESEPTAEKKAEIIKTCDEYLKAIHRIFEQMKKDEADIDRLNAETRTMLDHMQKAV